MGILLERSVVLNEGKPIIVEHAPNVRMSGFICKAPLNFGPGDEEFVRLTGKRQVSFDVKGHAEKLVRIAEEQEHNGSSIGERMRRAYFGK